MTTSHKNYRADYAVVGSGIAGLRAAIELSAAGSVLVLAKSNLSDSATAWAQGGIAVALSDEDETVLHEQDTINAGDGSAVRRKSLFWSKKARSTSPSSSSGGRNSTGRERNWLSRGRPRTAARGFCTRMVTRPAEKSAGRCSRGRTRFRTCTCGRTLSRRS